MAIYNKHHKNAPPGAIYIGRGSRWGNPYVIGKHGTREEVIEAYQRYLWQSLKDGSIALQDVAALDGKDLLCFCAPKPCHGEVLLRAAAWAKAQLHKPEEVPAGKVCLKGSHRPSPVVPMPAAELQEFKLIVAGGRDFDDYPRTAAEIERLADELETKGYAISIVSGMAKGADRCGWQFAINRDVKLHKFFADWDTHGKRAGYLRNEEMGRFADGLLAFWNKSSKGTEHMIEFMQRLGKPVRIVNY